MLNLPRKKIENLGRLKPKDALEQEIAGDMHRMIQASELFDKSKLPSDPFKKRKDDLIPIGKLEAEVRQHPINRDVGSSYAGVINYEDKNIQRDDMIQVLGNEILLNFAE